MLTEGAARTVRLLNGPTPLQELPRLARHLGGPRLLMKRDDAIPLGGGGNKLRKLEHLLGDALKQGADTVITPGALQSNHARLTAAAASRCGLRCILVLTDSVAGRSEVYRKVGNFLLYQIFGAEILVIPGERDSAPVMEDVAERERERGYKPYIVPLGGSNALGSGGYAKAFAELRQQAKQDFGSDVSAVVHATGSGGTQAGLVAGAIDCDWGGRIVGVSVGASKERQEEKVAAIVSAMRPSSPAAPSAIHVDDRHVGPGYGQPTREMVEAVRLVARLEAVLLDPVYTGKAMAGLLAMIGEGVFTPDDTVVFLHTGGSTALSAYWDSFTMANRGDEG